MVRLFRLRSMFVPSVSVHGTVECVLLGTIDLPLQFTKSIRLAGATVHWASDFKLVRLGYFCILTWMAFLRNYGDDRVAGNVCNRTVNIYFVDQLMCILIISHGRCSM